MPTFTISRNKYFDISHTHISKSNTHTYIILMSHVLNDIPKYSPENMIKYQKKILCSFHKIFLTPKKNMIFEISGDIPKYLNTNFKIKNTDIQNIINIYDRHNIKIHMVMLNWNVTPTIPFKNTIQLYKLNDLNNTQDIYESIISFGKNALKSCIISNDDETIKTSFYNVYYKLIGEYDVSKYNLLKYINNNT